MALLFARTALEADLYVDLHCEELGERPIGRRRGTGARRGQTFIVYKIQCESGKTLELEFSDLPEPLRGLRRSVSYGDSAPSQIIDPGQWMVVSDRHVEKAPGSVAGLPEAARRQARDYMSVAVACLDEVLKFILPGQTDVDKSLITSSIGRGHHAKDIRRYRKADIEARRRDFQDRLKRFASSRA